MDTPMANEMKFMQILKEKFQTTNKNLLSRSIYEKTIDELKCASLLVGKKKTRRQYQLLQKYEILECGDVEKLIRKRESPLSSPVYFVHIEETYGVISRAHIATGHGGRDRMHKHLSPKYANIHIEFLEIFKSFCLSCQEKKSRKRIKGIVVKPILSDNFNSRMQIDLIDMQSSRNSRYNWILVAQCHLTKFVVLRPLTSKRAIEVAHQVLDIFLLLGAPAILQSDNGSEFTAKVLEELKSLWPTLAMVHGKPRHPQS